MCTYQYEFISRYSRLSSILEMDTYLAQQAQREVSPKARIITVVRSQNQNLTLAKIVVYHNPQWGNLSGLY